LLETQRAIHAAAHGDDPSSHFKAADEIFTAAFRRRPLDTSARLWRGILAYRRGLFLQERGEDPMPDFDRALEDLDERVRLAGGWPEVLLRRGGTSLARGTYAASAGKDPAADFLRAEEDFSTALERDPWQGEARAGRGRLRLALGLRKERAEGLAAGEGLYAAATEDLEEAQRLNPTLGHTVQTDLQAARAKLEAARKR
jgi:tetratricopeptide (TPR) repeat protein